MKITEIECSEILINKRNSKKHSKSQINKIQASIEEFGFNAPLLLDETKTILAGHGRFQAAKQAGYDVLPCIILEHLSEAQKQAYLIADNKLGEIGGGWDEAMLKKEISEIIDNEIESDAFGFTDYEIEQLLEDIEEEEEIDEILHEQSIQLEPDKDYILVICKNQDEWDNLQNFLSLKKVRRGGYKKGSAFDAVGTERVITWERIENAFSKQRE